VTSCGRSYVNKNAAIKEKSPLALAVQPSILAYTCLTDHFKNCKIIVRDLVSEHDVMSEIVDDHIAQVQVFPLDSG